MTMSLFLDAKYAFLVGQQLDGFEETGSYVYNFRCPFCGDSKRDKLKKRGYFFEDDENPGLSFKCHNCSKANKFRWFLAEFDYSLYTQYLTEHFRGKSTADEGLSKPTKKPTKKLGKLPIYVGSTNSVQNLDSDHPCKLYITKRQIPDNYWNDLFYVPNFRKLYKSYMGEDNEKIPEDARLVIPFIDASNRVIGMQGRSLDPKCKLRYVTIRHPLAEQKVYGLNRIDSTKPVRVLEGPIDSMFVYNSIASADASLFKFGGMFPDMVFIFDIQPRNKDLLKIIKKTIEMGYPICLLPDEGYKDINDMVIHGGYTIEQINRMIDQYTFNGLNAKLEFTKWKKV